MSKAEPSGGSTTMAHAEPAENQIVVYQPDDTTRLSVCFDGETVWLSQEQMIVLFQRDRSVISRHIANAFKEGEVDKENCLQILQTNTKGRPEVVYNLEVVTSVGYRVKSLRGVLFRRWANRVLKEYLLRGYSDDNLSQFCFRSRQPFLLLLLTL